MMDAITLLQQRNSASKLKDPAPTGEALNNIYQAALRAPDHARLRPWRFLTVTGAARTILGDVFVAAANLRQQTPLSDEETHKLRGKALRAPLIIIVIASIKPHPKVPEVEQLLSAGCCAHAMLLAAQAEGFAGIWRTGGNAFDDHVKAKLGLGSHEHIVGFLYLGTIDGPAKPLATMATADFFQPWTGQ